MTNLMLIWTASFTCIEAYWVYENLNKGTNNFAVIHMVFMMIQLIFFFYWAHQKLTNR
jgi:hypothetical protein